jgi:hypothetical protein
MKFETDVDVATSTAPQHEQCESSFKRRKVPTAKDSACVTFCNDVRVYRHIHLNDMDETELRNAWYSQEELNEVKAECNRTVKLVVRGKLTPYASSSSSWTFRGLEFRTPEGANSRRANKEGAWDKVLDEQEAQYLTGNFDDEKIARIYIEVSRHCVEAAHLLGLSDAYAAQHDDNDREIWSAKSSSSSFGRHAERQLRRMRPFADPSHGALSTVA